MFTLSLSMSLPRVLCSSKVSIKLAFLFFVLRSTTLLPHAIPFNCLQLVFGLLALDGVISPMVGWLGLFLPLSDSSADPPSSSSANATLCHPTPCHGLFHSFLAPLLGLSGLFSPSSSTHRGE